MRIPRSHSTSPNSAANINTSAIQPIASRRHESKPGKFEQSIRCNLDDDEHDWHFQEFGRSHSNSGDYPNTNRAEQKPGSEHDGEIKRGHFRDSYG